MLQLIKPVRMLRGLFACVATGVLIACGGGGSNSTTSPATTTTAITAVSGKVVNAAGAPIAGATVSAAGKLLTTGSDGSYTFNIDPAATSTVVLVKKTGYATTAKELPIASGINTLANLQLFADQVSTTFSATATGSIPVNGATVTIPANVLRLAGSVDYTGTVVINASYYSPDTAQGVQAFAGPYTGEDAAGVKTPIISMGFMEVKLTNPSGFPLQLKVGAPATISFPVSSNSANAASVPLWFYDETAKIWKNEGVAARQADGTYLGSVAHFTIWNADFKGVTATIKGCFRDAAGQGVSDVGFVGLRTTGWSQNLFIRNVIGAAPGDFTILNVPADRPLEFYSANSPATFAPQAIAALSPGETRTLGTCITAVNTNPFTFGVITLPTGLFTVTAATVTTPAVTGTASFAGNYRGTFTGAEVGTFAVTISSAGVISGSTFSQTYNQTVPVTGRITDTGSVSITATGSAGTGQFSGGVNAAGTLSGTWNYQQSTVGGTFTGQRI